MHDSGKIPVAIIGCGSLGALVAKEIHSGAAGPYTLVAALDTPDPEKAVALTKAHGGKACTAVHELLAAKPRYVIEAATAGALKEAAFPAMQAGADLVVFSAGALADDAFAEGLRRTAKNLNRLVHVVSGAVGGFDLARAGLAAGDLRCTMINEKPPRAFAGAPYLKTRTLSEEKTEIVFEGTAREAIAAFPQNVNVVTAMSFATTGVDSVTTTVISNPAISRNRHTIMLEGAFGRARCEIEANPCPDNPKSSMLAAYSAVALLRQLSDPIRF